MQYSVRSRRRLRPATRDLLPQQITPARVPAPTEEPVAARSVLLDRPVIERVLPRAKRDSWQR